jgi:hypothetical protein
VGSETSTSSKATHGRLYPTGFPIRCTHQEEREIVARAERANQSASRFLVTLAMRDGGQLVSSRASRMEASVLEGLMVQLQRIGTNLYEVARRGDAFEGADAESTVGAGISFLASVLNWAVEEGLLPKNPIQGYDRPKTPMPNRPVATYDRYERTRVKADEVGGQRLFGPFLDPVEALGWRVSAICQLWASDIGRSTSGHGAPWPDPKTGRGRQGGSRDVGADG